MSVTEEDEKQFKEGIKDWMEACKKKFGVKKLGKLKTKSAQEVQQEQCKGKTMKGEK